MGESLLVTDSDLARARHDPGFRQRLLTESLERLLTELGKLQRAAPNPGSADQIREGVALAIKLTDLLRRMGPGASRAA
jgi:hypothetical protein